MDDHVYGVRSWASRRFGRFGRSLFIVLFAVALNSEITQAGTIADDIGQEPAFSIFAALMKSRGLLSELGGTAAFTVFVPSNGAYTSLAPAALHAMLAKGGTTMTREDIEGLIVSSKISPQDLAGRRTFLKTLNGKSIVIDATSGSLKAGDAEILSVDVTPTNGVIYEIDTLSLDPY
jgi:uncharacterized surface protein with fasciclin (FAS1) repeats